MEKKTYYEEHKEIMDARSKEWKRKNKEAWNAYQREYKRSRYTKKELKENANQEEKR